MYACATRLINGLSFINFVFFHTELTHASRIHFDIRCTLLVHKQHCTQRLSLTDPRTWPESGLTGLRRGTGGGDPR